MAEQLPFTFSRMQEFMSNYKNKITTILGAIVILIIGLSWFIHTNNKKRLQNLNDAEMCVQNILLKTSMLNSEAKGDTDEKTIDQLVAELQTLVNKDSAVRKRYEGFLVEELMLNDSSDSKLLEKYGKSSEIRLEKAELPVYANFSQISYLSSIGKFEEAREQAILLKEKLKSQPSDSSIFAATLLQIAVLEKKLNLTQECEKSLEELNSYLNTKDDKSVLSQETKENFALFLQEGNFTLTDFLKTFSFQ